VHERKQNLLIAAGCREGEPGRHGCLPDATLADYKKEPPVEQIH